MNTFTFFWRTASPFSQWHPVNFERDGISYNCAEQYMMYRKALLFNDTMSAERIMNAKHPRQQKKIGRGVEGYNDEKWNPVREQIVYDGNYSKFTQNRNLYEALIGTRETILVEASPHDCIWGVGLSEDDSRIQNPRLWQGKNLLGKILTRVREDLIIENEGDINEEARKL